ncbi:MAG: NAD(P)/FAD-dependent oxidoreductase [Hyphomicrobiaceae bacterium]
MTVSGNSKETYDIAVAGAGIVGVSCALWAQMRGMRVLLADGNPPGSGASYGNAGTIATYGCIPVNSPSLFRDLPKLLFSKTAPLRIDWGYALTHLPWMLKFLRNCTPDRVRHISMSLGDLLSHTDAGLDPLVEAAGAGDMFIQNDFIYAYATRAGYEGALHGIEVRRRNGVELEFLDPGEILELEPNLRMPLHAGVRFVNGRHARDPQRLVQRLFDRFIADGGTYVQTNVTSCKPDNDGVSLALSDGTTQRAGQFVIAAGAHSKSIVGSGAEDLPLDTERGYHVQFKDHARLVSRPVAWAEGGFYATPFDAGLRLAGTVEIAGLNASKTPKRIDVLTQRAHDMFGDIGEPDSDWMGFRPTMPDSLPVIGRSARSDRILFAFGHQHIGFTLGGITGRIIADLAEARAPNFDISAFSSQRFS